ncbi:MAG: NAD(P)-dependent oxidoreductase [Alphaproteobacteria bacterium]|nr:NAD(P)-dependent oxidoreductase [Alphaproteobacteria bacterium]
MTLKIGFIGIGAMGKPMVRCLLKSQYGVTAYDTEAAAMKAVEGDGARMGKSTAAVARDADVVVSMVPDTPDVEAVLFGRDGLLEGAKPGQLYIDMSTISPVASVEFAKKLAAKGVIMVDAPVTGSTFKAETGELNIFVGASKDDFERAKPILSAMGVPQHVGEQGKGHLVKIIHNTIIATTMVGVIEGLALAKRSGMDLKFVHGLLTKGTANGFLLEYWMPRTVLQNDYNKGFFTRHMVKDTRIALETGRSYGMPMMGTATSQQVYALACNLGLEYVDLSSIFKLYTENVDALNK